MEYLGKQAILSADDRRYADVEIPEWGGTVRARTLTQAELEPWEGANKNAAAQLLALTLVDGEGNPIFDETDVPALAQKSQTAAVRVMRAVGKLNGLSEEELNKVTVDFGGTPAKG